MSFERNPMYWMETGFLPKICSFKGCLGDPSSGSSYCKKHQKEKGRRDVGGDRAVNMRPSFEPGKTVHISPAGWTWIYFVRQGDLGPIKIGKARNLKARVSTLETANADHLQIVYAFVAKDRVEGLLHRLFADIRIRGEWFKPDDDLIDTISIMKRGVYPSVISENVYYKDGRHLTYWDL